MKNRFVGTLTITFPDGHVEKCIVKEKTSKGEMHFLKKLYEHAQEILDQAPKGMIKFSYEGDLMDMVIDDLMKLKGAKWHVQKRKKK